MLEKGREAGDCLPTDELFQALSHAIRRQVISQLILIEPDDKLTVEDIDYPESDGSVGLSLYHNHLPKLEATGVIDWNRSEGIIERGKHFPEIAAILKIVIEKRNELSAS
jgi:hypothetical protein